MGFSPVVQRKVLIECARHCCVCHRYKGVKIEVHHLIQSAHGGSDTFENAIPLCFDCHCDAGHYNPNHPRGAKLSIPELREARDNWYDFVKKNTCVEEKNYSKHIQISYYIQHSFDTLEDVLRGTFDSLNLNNSRVFLAHNEISAQWIKLLDAHLQDYKNNTEQNLIIDIKDFDSIEQYILEYQNIEVIDKAGVDNPFYDAERKTDWNEILTITNPNNFLKQLSESGISAKEFCTLLLKKNEMGCFSVPHSNYSEYLEITPISFLFIGITNASKESIKLSYLETKDKKRIKLPGFCLMPNEMALLPIATAINAQSIHDTAFCLKKKDGDRAKEFSRVLTPSKQLNNVQFFDKIIEPRSIIYNDITEEYDTIIHELDLNNIYSINSYWQCGSCPHLFYIIENKGQEYQKELLVTCSNKKGSEQIVIPSNVNKLIIRELEDELTIIEMIIKNGLITFENIRLEKGDSFFMDVNPHDEITIIGSYIPKRKAENTNNDIWLRNKIIQKSNLEFNVK